MPPTTTAVFLALRPYARRALFPRMSIKIHLSVFGRVGSCPNLKLETLAQCASPSLHAAELHAGAAHRELHRRHRQMGVRHTSLCPRQSYLTFEESKSLVTLWGIARSPLDHGRGPDALSARDHRAAREPRRRWTATPKTRSRWRGMRRLAAACGRPLLCTQQTSAGDERYVAPF